MIKYSDQYKAVLVQKVEELTRKEIQLQHTLFQNDSTVFQNCQDAIHYYETRKNLNYINGIAFVFGVIAFTAGSAIGTAGITFSMMLLNFVKRFNLSKSTEKVQAFVKEQSLEIEGKSNRQVVTYLREFKEEMHELPFKRFDELMEIDEKVIAFQKLLEELETTFLQNEYFMAIEDFCQKIDDVRNVSSTHLEFRTDQNKDIGNSSSIYTIPEWPFVLQDGKMISQKKAKVLNLNI